VLVVDDSGGRYVWRDGSYQWAGLNEQTGSGERGPKRLVPAS